MKSKLTIDERKAREGESARGLTHSKTLPRGGGRTEYAVINRTDGSGFQTFGGCLRFLAGICAYLRIGGKFVFRLLEGKAAQQRRPTTGKVRPRLRGLWDGMQ